MSRVTSLRACSSFSLDSARTDFLTVSCAWSEFVPTTSMEPQTLSISTDNVWGSIEVVGTNSRSEEHTSELQSRSDLVCRLLLVKKKASPAHAYRLACLFAHGADRDGLSTLDRHCVFLTSVESVDRALSNSPLLL